MKRMKFDILSKITSLKKSVAGFRTMDDSTTAHYKTSLPLRYGGIISSFALKQLCLVHGFNAGGLFFSLLLIK
jgi:hypothetical protein